MAEFRTDPGDRSVSELEREVDSERERVSATIDELQSRASMGNIVDQLVKAVGENGGEVSRNLGRSLRDNPMAALLTGVGLAWLIAGSGGSATKDPAWDADDPRYRGGTDPDLRTFGVSGGRGGFEPRGAFDGGGEEPSDGLGQRVADFAGQIGDEVSDAAAGLKERAADLTHAAGSGFSQARDTVRQAGASVRQHAGAATRSAAGTGRDMRQGLDGLIEGQPLVLGAIAMAIGAAVGGAMPRSRIEDKLFGEQSDQALETVRTFAEDQGAKLQATASAVADEALNIASEVSGDLGSKLPSAGEMVDAAETKGREAADRLRVAATAEPDRGSRPDNS
jgi:hypothetical protein